jgi:hypothetical protein
MWFMIWVYDMYLIRFIAEFSLLTNVQICKLFDTTNRFQIGSFSVLPHPPPPVAPSNSLSYCFRKQSPAGKKSQHRCLYMSQTYVSCPVYSVSSLLIRYIRKNLKDNESVNVTKRAHLYFIIISAYR